MAEHHPAGPSTAGSVVLELGPGQGALVLRTPPDLDGMEIEISRDDRAAGLRTHSQVRERRVAGGRQYAAVYPGLAPGDYTVWRDESTRAMTVNVADGTVTTTWWPSGQLAI